MSTVEAIPQGSIEYLRVPVSVTDGISSVITPDSVSAAVVDHDTIPVPSDFLPAVWSNQAVVLLLNAARPKGLYGVWVRIEDNPQTVLRLAGNIRIT